MLFKPVAMEIYLQRLKPDNHLATGSLDIITIGVGCFIIV